MVTAKIPPSSIEMRYQEPDSLRARPQTQCNYFRLTTNVRIKSNSPAAVRTLPMRRFGRFASSSEVPRRNVRVLAWVPPRHAKTLSHSTRAERKYQHDIDERWVDPSTDAALLDRAQHGDQGAFTQLVERYHAPLIRHCESYLKNHHRAEDSAQVALERAWINVRDCRGEFRPWLFKIARNHALDELKKPEHQRITQFPVEDDQIVIAGAEEPFDEMVARRIDLFGAINSLPPSYRAVVELRVTEEHFDTIATRLGIRPATARKHYSRALRALRFLLLGENSEVADGNVGWHLS
jgi:RNA polymerase sigma-70 factor, ECF subfamily